MTLSALLLLLCFFTLSSAQNTDAVWIFGDNGGYDWNGTGSTITNSQISTGEGCASISDANGNLIMYTDGINVWRPGQVAPVFTGMTGHPSSTQSGVIIPKPGTDDYWIISVDFIGPTAGHLSEMAYFDADVTGSLLNSVAPGPGNNVLIENSSEKVAAYRKPCDPDTIWVVGHSMGTAANSGQFEIFAATSTGIVPMNRTLPDQFNSNPNNLTDMRKKGGVLRFNHSGTILASAVFEEHVEMIGFDPNTGNFVGTPFSFNTLPLPNSNISTTEVYGLEFSPDDQTLYLSITGSITVEDNSLWQYDVSLPTVAAIENSRIRLYSAGATASVTDTLHPAQIQLAPDGNIYVAMYRFGTPPRNESYLGRISNPNVGGVANFDYDAIAEPGNWVRLGLPTFLTEPIVLQEPVRLLCEGESVQLQTPAGTNHMWSPATDLSCTACQNPTASPTADITYTLQYTDLNGDCQTVEYPIDVEVCDPCADANLVAAFSHTTNSLTVDVQDLSTANGQSPVSYIEWNFGDGSGWIADIAGTDYSHTYAQSGTYTVCLHAAYFISPDICCHDTICVPVTVLLNPCDGFTANFLSGQIPSTLDVQFDDVSNPASNLAIWDFGDGSTMLTNGSGAPVFTHTYPGPGRYDVTLIAIYHPNGNLDSCCIDTLTRRIRVLDPGTFRIAPSVTSTEVEVQLLVKAPEAFVLRIYGMDGRAYRSVPIVENGALQLDVRDLVPGVYYVELQGNGERYVQKLIKR